MFIKKLILENFQKHKNLSLDFSPAINIVHGNSDAGKSCIIRAIGWLFFNSIEGNSIRKEGTKQTTVQGIFDNGISITRIKSNTINRYILEIPNEKKRVFDSIGKNIPEEIKKIISLDYFEVDGVYINLNIADQMTMPFLLDKSGTFRMKLFNKLAGADIVDKSMVSLNKDILHIGREEKLEKEHLEEQEKNLKELTIKKEKCQVVYNLFTTSYNELKEKLSTYETINTYSEKLNDINKGLEEANNKLKNIKIVDNTELLDLGAKIKRLEKLNEQLYKIKTVKKELLNIEEQLKKTIIPEIDIKELQEKVEKLTELQKAITRLNDIEKANEDFTSKIYILTKKIEEDSKKWQELLKKAGICPVCKRVVGKDEEIKL